MLSSDNVLENESIEIKILTMDEKFYFVFLKNEETIHDLKEKIEILTEVPKDKQRLIFKGKLLENEKKINDYQINNHDAIHLIAKVNQSDNIANISNNIQNDNLNMRRERDPFTLNFFPLIQPMRRRRIREISNNFDVNDLLYSIIQNNLCLEDFISNSNFTKEINHDEYKDIKDEGNKLKFIDFDKRKFTIGQWIDVKDTIHQWLEAEVIEIQDNNSNESSLIKIHYIGWGNNWDEWISFNSKRIMPFRYYTVDKFKDKLCPSIKNINSSRINYLFKNYLNQIQKNNDQTDNFSNEASISNILFNMKRYYQIIDKKVDFLQKIKESLNFNSIKNNDIQFNINSNENNNLKLSQDIFYLTLKQLSPIIDRFGRSLIDISNSIDNSIKLNSYDKIEPTLFKVVNEDLKLLENGQREIIEIDLEARTFQSEYNLNDRLILNAIPSLTNQSSNQEIEVLFSTIISEPTISRNIFRENREESNLNNPFQINNTNIDSNNNINNINLSTNIRNENKIEDNKDDKQKSNRAMRYEKRQENSTKKESNFSILKTKRKK